MLTTAHVACEVWFAEMQFKNHLMLETQRTVFFR